MDGFTLLVSPSERDPEEKHVQLLYLGKQVQADIFRQPFSVTEVGSILMNRYRVPDGVYTLEGLPVTPPVEEAPVEPSEPVEEEEYEPVDIEAPDSSDDL